MLRFVSWLYLTLPVVLRGTNSGDFRALEAGRETALAACVSSRERRRRSCVKPASLLNAHQLSQLKGVLGPVSRLAVDRQNSTRKVIHDSLHQLSAYKDTTLARSA